MKTDESTFDLSSETGNSPLIMKKIERELMLIDTGTNNSPKFHENCSKYFV